MAMLHKLEMVELDYPHQFLDHPYFTLVVVAVECFILERVVLLVMVVALVEIVELEEQRELLTQVVALVEVEILVALALMADQV
jgi:hypothetical protein